MYNPNPITKVCPVCSTPFESLEHHHKEYCSPTCKRKAKTGRQALANHADVARTIEIYENSNPSDEVLDVLAQACINNPTLIFMFHAVSVNWQPPEGVTWLVKPDSTAMLTQT